jgi:hypothetical protein
MAENSILSKTLFTLAKAQRSNSSLSPSSRVSKTKDDINLSQLPTPPGFLAFVLFVYLFVSSETQQATKTS